MAYQRKTRDEYEIQGKYYGKWELETTETTYKEAREQLKTYRENVPGVQFKIVVKRVKLEPVA